MKNTQLNNKNENMKMRKKLITALVLGACVGTQAFAQNTKQDTITFALTAQGQSSVSTTTAANAGNWSSFPTHYKTATSKLTQVDIMRAIAIVLHGNPNYYSSKATLMLVQGELSGFFNIDEYLASTDYSYAEHSYSDYWDSYYLDGDFYYYEEYDSTSISYEGDTYIQLATGRNFEPVPDVDVNDVPVPNPGDDFVGDYPPGHMEPWGQIFVKDPANSHYGSLVTVDNPLCENVTFFFALTVQECYDCYYLNSFISDTTFVFKPGTQPGPPCCSGPESLSGCGVDRYYLTLSFDNTVNNHYLNPEPLEYGCGYANWFFTGYEGLSPSAGPADGLDPDLLGYSDPIRSGLGRPSPYEMRFTLNGILTYTWCLKFVNTGDSTPDFVGTASYSANGYGFIALTCDLLTGSATFTEKIVKDIGCCDDTPWWDSDYNDPPNYTSWYGPGNRDAKSDGYYDDESPFNPDAALTYHNMDDLFIWSSLKPYCN